MSPPESVPELHRRCSRVIAFAPQNEVPPKGSYSDSFNDLNQTRANPDRGTRKRDVLTSRSIVTSPSAPNFEAACEAVRPTGKDGRPGPSLEGGSTSLDLEVRSPLPGASVAALGTYANSSSPPPSIALLELSQESKQTLKIISRFAMQDSARVLLPQQRVSHCLRHQAFGQEGVRCIHVPSRKGARLGGLQTCGSIWACPLCSPKITERRRVELREAVDAWRALGGVVVLLTYTFSHQLDDDLKDLHSKMMRARSASMSGAPYHKLKEGCGLVGSVRSVELTHGLAGWHPHIHELAFVAPAGDVPALIIGMEKLWHRGLSKVGLSASLERGFDAVRAGDEIENYIAKYGHEPTRPVWDCSAEITKQPAKLGRVKGRTPFQLLSDFSGLEGAAAEAAGRLFQEYAGVMLGKRQLEWSRWNTGEKTEKGRPKTISFLKHLIGKEELSDDEVAELSEDDGVTLAVLSYPRWCLIAADRRRAELFNLLCAGDVEGLACFLADYPVMRTGGVVKTWRVVLDTSEELQEAKRLGLSKREYLDYLRGGVTAIAVEVVAPTLPPTGGRAARRLKRKEVIKLCDEELSVNLLNL